MKSICFFSSYFNQPTIPYFIKFYLENLTPYFSEVVFLTNNNKQLDDESNNFLSERNIKLNYFENEGFDFGMWYKAFGIYDVNAYDRVGLVNDSCILFRKPDEFFGWLDATDYDYCGMVDSNAISYHLQSYFLIINKKAIPEVAGYFKQHGIVKDIKEVIKTYEIGMSAYLVDKGLKLGACYSTANYTGEFSPMYLLSEKLIVKGFPLIKKKIILCSFRKEEFLNLMRMKFHIDPRYHIRYIKQLYRSEEEQLINFDSIQKEVWSVAFFLKLQCFKIVSFFFQILRKFKM
jgi:lipopolysaccharide biosynthesis protein